MPIYMFRCGDVVVDDMGKQGVVEAVRDDAYERRCREADPQHGYYYHIHYTDGTFNTYVPGYTLTRVLKHVANK